MAERPLTPIQKLALREAVYILKKLYLVLYRFETLSTSNVFTRFLILDDLLS